ncbi:zinc ABC transporter substrate-binding protein [Pusillimonas sp. MFBS29]|uniref:metal ABC transporter solute-binding protein, Zn/Mn family n=1 Tax=Pusillimonas sp. MFBS29 TaxID=2886690 RepID=UPI001D126860|nr:zinc ABC transporter substrate-binding protein [Pusillimonas sp. MFBS29]MCC2597704.1 zinc ABC transporter substrate-binding protein [Pusillimonas sp. MFBS29]
MASMTSIRPFQRIRRLLLGACLISGLSGVPALVLAEHKATEGAPLKVVATFSILGDLVSEIGGAHVNLTTLVGPNGDAHTFEPSPTDVKALAQAEVLVLNGLDFEVWLPRLIGSAGFQGHQVLASKGVAVRDLHPEHHEGHDDHAGNNDQLHIHGEDDVDPHAWQSLENGIIYVQNIAEGLSSAAPEFRAFFKNRADLLIEQLTKLDKEIKLTLSVIPPEKRKVVSAHDAFGYFAQAYGIQFIPVAGLASQAEPSAREMAAIIDLIKKEDIKGVFLENSSSSKLATQIARETGAVVGATLYSDALAPAGQPGATYLGMFIWNAGQLIYVLQGDPEKNR